MREATTIPDPVKNLGTELDALVDASKFCTLVTNILYKSENPAYRKELHNQLMILHEAHEIDDSVFWGLVNDVQEIEESHTIAAS
jgi:hypothetical protein